MRRRWSPAVGCLAVLITPFAFLILAAVGTPLVPSLATDLFPPTIPNLTRTWTCRYPYATETLTFRPTGACVQSITFDSGRVINNTGHWSFDPSDCQVELTDVTVVDNAFGGPATELAPTAGMWAMPARRSVTGSVYLVQNEDVDLYFR